MRKDETCECAVPDAPVTYMTPEGPRAAAGFLCWRCGKKITAASGAAEARDTERRET